jgi:hypothetical protein
LSIVSDHRATDHSDESFYFRQTDIRRGQKSRERKVNLPQQDQALQAAQAAARRLLLRTIDLRFDLDDTAETLGSRGSLHATDLQRLRSDADALRHAIDRLAEVLCGKLR